MAASPIQRPPLHLLDLPSEIRSEIWRYCVAARCNKHPVPDAEGLFEYHLSLHVLRVSRAVHAEAQAVFRRCNNFVKIVTPWPNTKEYVAANGRVPILMSDQAAIDFHHVQLEVRLDVPEAMFSFGGNSTLIITEDDLPLFGRLWWYTELTQEIMNQHLRLQLVMRNPEIGSGKDEDRPLPRSLQTRLLDPFTNVKRLAQVSVTGQVDTSVRETFMTRIKEPYESPESCLDRATDLKDEGNKALADGKPRAAVDRYEAAFRAMFIIIHGRVRDEWGEAHFDRRLVSGRYRDQPGNFVRLLLRIELVANTVLAYVRLRDFDLARYWGMRSIDMARAQFGDSVDYADLDFDGAGYWGRVYFGTALACRELGNTAQAIDLFRIARLKLPNDDIVNKEIEAFQRVEAAYWAGGRRAQSEGAPEMSRLSMQ